MIGFIQNSQPRIGTTAGRGNRMTMNYTLIPEQLRGSLDKNLSDFEIPVFKSRNLVRSAPLE